MLSRGKFILGSIFLILGVVSLVFGFLLYIDTSGFNVLLFAAKVHDFVFAYILARIMIAWGVALIASGIIFILLGVLKKKFNSKKPLAAAVAVLIVAMAVTGLFVYVAIPPGVQAHAEVSESSQYTQVGTDKPVYYNVSSYSNYHSMEYFNVSLNGKLLFNQSFEFKGYKNTSLCIPPGTFSSSGNYTISISIVHGTYKKEYSSWVDVKPYTPMIVTISGPNEVTDGYTGNFSAHVTGGYGPYTIKWEIYGEHNHVLSGNDISFKFGDYYYGYTITAYAIDKYGAVNSTCMTAYLTSNLSASYSDKYAQLDQYMTDTFNASTYSGVTQTGVGPYSYYWYEDSNLFSTNENSTYQFNTPGIYNISLEVKDSENQTSLYYQNIIVNPRLTLWSYGPFVTSISGSQCIDFWYNVTGGTWYQNVSFGGHYDVTFYINGQGYVADNSFFSNDVGHYEFDLSDFDLSTGQNSFKVVVHDGVGQTSVFSIELYYST